ncbi:MAG: hypothetical protein ABJG68_00170 [Crocinitomicaceae bacterium]
MRYLILLTFCFPILTHGQGFITIDTLTTIPTELTDKLNGQISSVVTVDFTGDSKLDYLVTMASEDKHNYEYLEYWITSEFELFKKKKKFNDGIQYYHFVNLDRDPEPEIFSAFGYEDGIDYGFFDLDLKLGKEELIFYFNPVIIEGNKYHWGYPWDIANLLTRNSNGTIQIQSSIEHTIVRDGNITFPEDQPFFPVIFFSGHSTQPYELTEIESRTWLTIEQLKMEAHNRR